MKINLNNKAFIILISILIVISSYAGYYMTTATAFPENPGTYAYFTKIAEMTHVYHKYYVSTEDFWKNGGDCDERALVFREYLESKGATNIQTIHVRNIQNGDLIQDYTGAYGHTFILWNGGVYNPSLNTTVRIYNGDLNDYKKLLKGDYYQLNAIFYENGTSEWL